MAPTAIPPEAVSALIADFDHIGWWEAFLLLLIFLSTLVVIAVLGVHPISPIPYYASMIATPIGIYGQPPPELPMPVFWVMFFAILPFTFGVGNGASIAIWSLTLSHLDYIAAVMPALFFIYFALSAPIVLTTMTPDVAGVPAGFFWLAVVFVMRDKIHFLMPLSLWGAWPLFYIGLNCTFWRAAPPVWNISAVIIVVSLWWLLKAAESTSRFAAFGLALSIIGALCRALFNFIFLYPETYLFPFNLISHWYKVPQAAWKPVTSLENPPTSLCPQCKRLVQSSSIILGSRWPLVPLVEWHTVSLRKSSVATIVPCDLCPLIWALAGLDGLGSPGSDEKRWKVKVWQQRPISRYAFAKLYCEDQPVGNRLLIQRGKNFREPCKSVYQHSTGSEAHIALAMSWLSDCRSHHRVCSSGGNTPRAPPTRLIQVERGTGDDTALRIKLVLSGGLPVKYLAFSHCWGGSSTLELREANVEEFQTGIDPSSLSKNMQDAVAITQRLGYNYIWIDSLCIIQDSYDDWNTEAAKIEGVYAGADCTLASTGSASGDGGCFHGRLNLRSLRACKVGVSGDTQPEWIYIRRDDLSDFCRGVDRAPLNQRGWVLQERLLSRRILHFGAEMLYWECCLRSASELCPTGYVYKKHPHEYYGDFLPPPIQIELDGSDLKPKITWKRSGFIQRRLPQPDLDLISSLGPSGVWQARQAFMKERRRHGLEPWRSDSAAGRHRTALEQIQENDLESQGILSFAQIWYIIIESFSVSRLSFATDKFIAMKGIVDEVQRATKYHYVAGLWEEHLVECLLWFVTQGPSKRLRETKKAQATPVQAESTTSTDLASEPQSTPPSQPEAEITASDGSVEALQAGVTIADEAPAVGPLSVVANELIIGPRMAPTWSWVSVDGPVSLNQFPVSASRKVYTTRLATECSATASSVSSGPGEPNWNAMEGVLKIKAPLLKIKHVERDGDQCYIYVGPWARRRSARLLPDLATFNGDTKEDGLEPELFCVSLLSLRRDTETIFRLKLREVQGLVVKRIESRDEGPDVYERVGFFSTTMLDGGSPHLRRFNKGPLEEIHVT